MPIIGWKTKALGAVLLLSIGFIAGWKVCGWRQSAEHEKTMRNIIAEHKKTDTANREIITQLQAEKQQVITNEVIRYVKIKDVTDGRVCFADWGAVRLWNDALSGQKPVPKDSTGATTTTDGASVTDTQVLENLNTNAARWEQLRMQMHKIIEWDKETFGVNE